MEKKHAEDPDLPDDIDFSGGVRGKYAEKYAKGTNVVVLEPDVAKVFPTAESVNRALRAIAAVIEDRAKAQSRSRKKIAATPRM